MSVLRTAVSLFLGLALAAGPVAEVHGFHDCPHHGAHGDGSGGHAGHAGPAAHGHGHRPAPGPHASGPLEAPPEGPCTCIGSCHGVPTAPGLATVPSVPVAPTVSSRLVARPPDDRARSPGAYLLPFANAPPVLPA